MDFIEIEGKKYEVTGHDQSGVPIIKGVATSVHHTDESGNLMYDKEGYPVRSVHVSASPVEPVKEEK